MITIWGSHQFPGKYYCTVIIILPPIDRLGYSPHGGSGWCTLKIVNSAGRQDTFAVVFGNDLWIYLTFITVTLLYSTTHCYIKFQVSCPYYYRPLLIADIHELISPA